MSSFPVTARLRRTVLALSLGHTVTDLYQGAVLAIIPFLVAERQYTYAAATGITLAATFLSSLAQPAFGVLTDRRSLWWLVPAGTAVAGVGVGLSGLGDSYLLTWSAIALSGLGVAAFHPEGSRATRAASAGSARAMSWFALGGNAGFALSPLLVTPVLAAGGLGWTPVLAVPALVVAGALAARGHREARAARARPAAPPPAGVDDWVAFRWLTGLVMCRSVFFFGVSSFLALYFTRYLGADRSQGGLALTAFLTAGAAGTLLGGRLADRWGRVVVVRAGYALCLPALAALLLAPTATVAYPVVVLLGVGAYLPFSVQVTLGQEYLPTRVGTASGVTLGLAVSVGGAVAPALGLLADHTGLVVALGTLLAVPVVALLLSVRLPEPTRGHRRGRTVR